jgi:hypothetical protein
MGKAKTQGVRVPKSGFYLVDYEIRYETTLKNSELIFAVVNTMEDFNRLLNDPRLTVRWLSFAPAAFPSPTVDVFDVVNASVAGLPLAIARVQREGRHEITATSADMSALIGKHVVVSYRYRAMVPKSAHVLFADIAIPTKDAKIEFDFRDTDMAYVNVHDFFVSNRPVDLQYFPNYAEASVITVRAQDWLFPKSGAVFTWALTSETRDGSAGRPGAGRRGRVVGSSPVS